MSIDQLAPPTGTRPATDPSPHTDDEDLPRVVNFAAVATDTIDTLLQHAARGDQTALDTLQTRITGLVQVNIRRILRDAPRSEAATQETFTDLHDDVANFDPHRDDALTWLLTRAHQHALGHLNTTTNDLINDLATDLATDHPTSMSLAH